MSNFADLVLGVDTTGLLRGEAALKSLTATGAQAEAKLGAATDAMSAGLARQGAATERAGAAMAVAARELRTGAASAAASATANATAANTAVVLGRSFVDQAMAAGAGTTASGLLTEASLRLASAAEQVAGAVNAGTVSQEEANRVMAVAMSWYDGVADAAARAAMSTRDVIEANTGLTASVGGASAGTQEWVAELNRQAASFDALRASVDPAFAATQRYQAAVLQAEAAVKSGIVSQSEANAVLKMAEARYGMAAAGMGAVDGKAKGMFASVGGSGMVMKNLAFQLNQIGQQGAITGNYLGALSIQLPDMLAAFGFAGVLIGGATAVLGPFVLSLFDTGNAAKNAEDRLEGLMGALSAYRDAADTSRRTTQALREEFDAYADGVRRSSEVLANVALQRSRDALATDTSGMFLSDLDTLMGQLSEVERAWNEVAKAKNDGLSTSQQIADFTDAYEVAVAQASELEGTLGLTAAQAKQLNAAFDNLGKASGMGDVAAAAQEVLDLIEAMYPAGVGMSEPLAVAYEKMAAVRDAAAAGEVALNGASGATISLTSGLGTATANAWGLSSALAQAFQYAASIRSAIEGMNFTNIGVAAENAALLAGQTAVAAAATGRLAEERAKLAPMLGSEDAIIRQQAQSQLSAYEATLQTNVALQEEHAALLKAANAAGKAGGAGAKAGKEAEKAMKDAAKAAEDLAEKLQGPAVSAIDGMAGAFGDFVAGGLRDFKSFGESIVASFRRMLAEMVAMSIANPIRIAMGLTAGMSPAELAVGGGNAAGGGTGILGSLTSGIGGFFKSIGGGLSSVWTGLTTGGLSGALGSITSALSGIGGAATGFAGLGAAIGAIAGPIGIVVGLLSAFKTKTKLLDQGLKVTVTGMDTLVETYKKVEKSKLFGLIKHTSTSGGAASAEVADPITAAVADIQSSIMDAADVLGVAGAAFDGFSYEVKISTKGMSKDEALQALQDKIAEVGDAFAGMIPGLADLQKQGEGATDALTRLSNSLSAVNSMTDTLGLTFEAVGLTGADMASQLADAFGGLDAMASAQATYFQSFYTESERVATMTRQATEALAELGGAMPRTRDEYRAMVAAQDLTTEAGRELFAALVSLAGVMDQVLPAVASFTRELEALAATATGQLDDMISQTTEAQRAALSAASAWYDVADNLRDFVSDMRASASELVSATAARAYNEARYQQLLAATLAGDRGAAADLTGAASALIDSTNATARSSAEAAIAQARIMSDLGLAAGASDIYGAQQDVVASLLGEQVDILTEVRDYLAAGGTLDPAHIDALNGQLGSLQAAIEAAQAVDYASIMASLDATVTVIDGVTDPALRTLLESATSGLTATVDFIARLDGLTPAERWLALNSETEHLRTIAMIARDEIPLNLATLALDAASETERAVRIVLGADTLTEAQRAIALAASSELQRTILFTLASDSSPEAQALALATGGIIARTIAASVDLSALTDEQRAFITALSGAQTGSLVLGGSFVWNPSEGFEAWFDRVTAENVANPLVALASPMAELRASLDLLTATLREVQSSTPTAPTAPTTPTDTGGGSNTAAALASLQSQGAAVLATRDAAQSAVATYNRLYGAWETEVFGRSSGGPAQATLNSANRQLEDLRAQVIDLGGIPAFLRGGDHAGGWRMVGEAGPELEATGPSRIFNARETKRIMSGAPAKPDDAALIAELRALRKEVAELRDQNRQLDTRVLNEARKTRFIAEKWDADGMPAVRA